MTEYVVQARMEEKRRSSEDPGKQAAALRVGGGRAGRLFRYLARQLFRQTPQLNVREKVVYSCHNRRQDRYWL